ncbi:MAG: hypothetical protein ACJAYK_000457 [Crocinitomicaceae bacterium]|jgi:hypothetical protein
MPSSYLSSVLRKPQNTVTVLAFAAAILTLVASTKKIKIGFGVAETLLPEQLLDMMIETLCTT